MAAAVTVSPFATNTTHRESCTIRADLWLNKSDFFIKKLGAVFFSQESINLFIISELLDSIYHS
jgi:hypothetical protein